MKIDEVSRNFKIPLKLIKYYEDEGVFDDVKTVDGIKEYGDKDIEILSRIVTLKEAGFKNEDILRYIRLINKGDSGFNERISILNKKRQMLLDEVHKKHKSIDSLDWLIYDMKAKKLKENGNGKEK